MRISAAIRKQIRQELARAGGKARAEKYDAATLSKWASKGGRPRKDAKADQGSASSRQKGRKK